MFILRSFRLDFRSVEKSCEKMSALTGLNIVELKMEGDRNSLIQYFLDGPLYSDEWHSDKGIHAIQSVFSLQRLVNHVDKHAKLAPEVSTVTAEPLRATLHKSSGP